MERWAKRQQLAPGASRLSWNKSDGSGENNGWIGESGDHIKQLHGRGNALARPRPARAVPNTRERGIGEANHAHARYHLLQRRSMVTGDSYATTEALQVLLSVTQTTTVSVGDTVGTAEETSLASLTGYSPETVPRVPRATLDPSSERAIPSSSPAWASVIQLPPSASESGRVSLAILPPDVTGLSTSATTEASSSPMQSITQSVHSSSLTAPLPSSSYEPNPSSSHTQATPLRSTSSPSPPPIIASNPSTLPSSGGSGNSSSSTFFENSSASTTISGSPASSGSPPSSGLPTSDGSIASVIAAGRPTSTAASSVNLSSLLVSLSQSLASASSESTLPSSTISVLSTSTLSSLSQGSTTATAESSLSQQSFSTLVSSTSASVTGGAGGLAPGPGPANSGAGAPTSRPEDGESVPNSNPGPAKPVLIGGIVGGVAGLAILIVFFLFLLRWRKQRQHRLGQAPSASALHHSPPSTGVVPPPSGGAMTETSSPPRPIGPAGFLDRFRPTSQQTASSETAPDERGFYRVSGRKIAPALTTGGDGYQGPTLSETSFYRDEGGFYGGTGTSARPISEGGLSSHGIGASEGEIVVMRPSPARRPVTSEGPSLPTLSPPVGSSPSPRPRPDLLGRSHPSHDGSRGSRFTEDVV